MERRVTYCRVCEGGCGLLVDLDGDRVVKVLGDVAHPLSRGYTCVKGRALGELHHDPDRLRSPVRRSDNGDWETISWETAAEDIAQRLRAIVERYGHDSIAAYFGTGFVMNPLTRAAANCLVRSFGIGKVYSISTIDCVALAYAASKVLGEPYVPFPDWERARYMLVLGHNPVQNQFSFFQSRPRGVEALKHARAEGARAVLVDPRRTESASLFDEHLYIVPGTDAFLVLALLHVVIGDNLYDRDFVVSQCEGFESLSSVVVEWTPERAAILTSIQPETIRRIGRDFAKANGAFCLGHTGVTMAPNASIAEWAILALNAITGNLDRPGGLRWNPEITSLPSIGRGPYAAHRAKRSRVGDFPRFLGELPAATLADEILTTGEGQVRALIVVGGNPVLTCPNEMKVVRALSQLDLLVCIDLYVTQTGAFADYVLPAADPLERSEIRNPQAHRNSDLPFLQFAPRVVEPVGDVREEWRIFRDLNKRLGVSPMQNPQLEDRIAEMEAEGGGPDAMTRELLGEMLEPTGLSISDLEEKHPHGIVMGDRVYGEMRANGWHTPSRRVQLAPDDLVAGAGRLDRLTVSEDDPPFYLIGRRVTAQWNSAYRNLPSIIASAPEHVALLNTDDARRLGVIAGQYVVVHNHVGEVRIKAEPSDEVASGVVVVAHGWGHRYPSGERLARRDPGVNVNLLIDDRDLEPFTGNPYQTAVKVWISVDGA